MKLEERIARTICESKGIDPDKKTVGLGSSMPRGAEYFLWEAQVKTARDIIQTIKDFEDENI